MTWRDLLADYKQTESFRNCLAYVQQRRDQGIVVYPPKEDVFNVFRFCEFEDVRVVILGQDPYHGPGQAHGLCFSVSDGTPLPPSLLNIYKELQSDLGIPVSRSGDLSHWAKQGVFLLNTVLTVEQGQAHSHQGIGWEEFTDHVIQLISEHCEHVVFLLWGAAAQKKQQLIDLTKHTVLKAPHPSPLSAHRGFLGCRHFSKANKALKSHKQNTINWQRQ
jgi:uracil-DNA glycosylase